MFTRVVEIRTKPGKARELTNNVSDKILPLLRKQAGFVDEITLLSNTESDRVLAISFWQTEQDAERYQREQFQQVTEIISTFIDAPPKVQTFTVDTSTTHRIAKGKAA